MESRTVTLTLHQAKEWYNKGGDLKEVALQAYKEEELQEPGFKSIKFFGDALYFLSVSNELNDSYARMLRIVEDLERISRATAASYKLNIIRKALNFGKDLSLIKGDVWYPYCPFVAENSTYYTSEIARGEMDVVGRIRLDGETYRVLGGDDGKGAYTGLGAFMSGDAGTASTPVGFLGCASKEIAQHFGRYFAKEIFDAKYGDLINYKWI